MQIIILGMHRSGTSMLTRLVNMMGVYFGEDGDAIGTNQENPNGFWERKDVRKINDYVLQKNNADWDLLAGFDENTIDISIKTKFTEEAGEIVKQMDCTSPWLIKEPRVCVLMDLWKAVLKTPIYIHIYRNPLEVASSLFTRNGISIPEGIALWEKYNVDALNGSTEPPGIVVSHQSLIKNPVAEVRSIYDQLTALGVEKLTEISEDDILSFVDPSLYRERYNLSDLQSYLNSDQLALFQRLESRELIQSGSQLKVSKGASLVLDNYQNKKLKIENLQVLNERLRVECDMAVELQREILVLAEQASKDINDILQTTRWKLGDRVVSVANLVSLKKRSNASAYGKLIELQKKIALRNTSIAKKS